MKKLVRDLIPKIFEKSDKKGTYYNAQEPEYKELLKQKLLEEAHEFFEAGSEVDSIEELADVLEVIDAIYAAYNFDKQQVRQVQEKKRAARGGFKERIVLSKQSENFRLPTK